MASSTARMHGPTPSAQELVAALSAPEAPAPVAPAAPTMRLPRPHPISRVLIVAAIGLLAGTALLAAVLAWSLAELHRAVRIEAISSQPAPVALPPSAVLVDDRACADWLARHPDEAPRLQVARAVALRAAGRREDAVAAYAAAAARGRLAAIPRLDWAELLCDLGQPGAAQAVLDQVDHGALGAELRTRALALAGRIHLLLRRPMSGSP